MKFLNASLFVYATYFAYIQNNSFVRCFLLDLEVGKPQDIYQEYSMLHAICCSKTISCLTPKMQHFFLKAQEKVAHSTLIP